MGFKDKLKKELKRKLSREKLDALPSGFQTLGNVIILKLKSELLPNKQLIAQTCLEMMPYIRSVYINLGKISGQYREPEKIEYLAGDKNPIVEHKEHGVTYTFDITKIMFSKGNLYERKHLASLVEDGEIIVDMFAGIGYFSLPIAINADPEKIYSIEINPISYDFLRKNIKLNNLDKIITPIKGDSKKEVVRLSKKGVRADRVIMGVFPAPKDYIEEALTLVKQSGTLFHYEGIVDKDDDLSLFKEFSEIVKRNGLISELKDKRFVKSFGPNLYHIVYDIRVY